jgi:hypothetical protein
MGPASRGRELDAESCVEAPGFHDRGLLRVGALANARVYHFKLPEREFEVVHGVAGNEWSRILRPKGSRWTIVNGQITFENDRASPPLVFHGAIEKSVSRALRLHETTVEFPTLTLI